MEGGGGSEAEVGVKLEGGGTKESWMRGVNG